MGKEGDGFIQGSGMIAGAMDWIRRNTRDLRRPLVEINGRTYDPEADRFLPDGYWGVATRRFFTLNGLCEYLGAEGMEISVLPNGRPGIQVSQNQTAQLYVHVTNYDQVYVRSATLPGTERQIVVARADAPRVGGVGGDGTDFECPVETAVDILLGNYYADNDLPALVEALSEIRLADKVKIEAKGISHRITTSRKTQTNPEGAELVNPLILTPILGFPEIAPASRKYNARLSNQGDKVCFKLSAITDPHWEAVMVERAKAFLCDQLQPEKTENNTSWHVFR